MRKTIAFIGLAIGIAALIVQFSISIPAYLAQGLSMPLAVLKFFAYFTILTNISLVLIYLGAVVRGQAWLQLFRSPTTRAAAAAAIFLVMVFYHFFIAPVWAPKGLFLVCDVLLHYVTPIVYLVWFVRFNRSGTLKWNAIPKMLVVPAIYVVLVMTRGAILGEYPYDILDAKAFGYVQVGLGVLALLVALTVLNAAAIAIDRALLFPEKKYHDPQ